MKLYEDIESVADDGVPRCQWRIQDFVNAVISAGLTIKEMQEFHSLREDLPPHNYLYDAKYDYASDTFDWHVNPWAALPQCLSLCSQK